MFRSLASLLVASLLAFGLTGCDSSPQATTPTSPQTERSAQKTTGITIDGPREVAPGQSCNWAAIIDGNYGHIDWYKDLQEKIGTGAYYSGSFADDTELEVKVYDDRGNFLNSYYFDLEVCSSCTATESECRNLTPVPSP